MPTDPFVAPELDDRPRQEPNLAPGRAHARRRRRGAPTAPATSSPASPPGTLLGRPGPERRVRAHARRTGCATGRARRRTSHAADALAVIAELAMKRAASFGRAPTMTDVEIAASLLGYQGEVDADVRGVARRRRARRRPRVRRAARDRRRGPRRGAAAAAAGAGAARRVPRRAAAAARPLTPQSPADGHASGSRPRRRARSTSAARAPRCSTGSSPATTAAASSSCASRTPTSPARRDEWVVGIQDTLRWLGLDWDEGPVLQSDALRPVPRRRRPARSPQGDAYECYCTEDEVQRAQRRRDRGRAARPGYDGHCRDLTADERAALAAEGRPRVDPVPHARRRA